MEEANRALRRQLSGLNDNGAATWEGAAPLDRAAEGAMTAVRDEYAWLSFREVRPSTSTRMWLRSDTRRRPPVDGADRL